MDKTWACSCTVDWSITSPSACSRSGDWVKRPPSLEASLQAPPNTSTSADWGGFWLSSPTLLLQLLVKQMAAALLGQQQLPLARSQNSGDAW